VTTSEIVQSNDVTTIEDVAEVVDSGSDVQLPQDVSEDADDASLLDTVQHDGSAKMDALSDAAQDGETTFGGDGACFHGAPPSGDVYVADIPQPNTKPCKWSSPKFFPSDPPAVTLQVDVGTHDPKTGQFVPYVDGQWLPMVHGPQGGFHVFAAIRVTLPGQSDPIVKLQSEAIGWVDCEPVALGQQPVIFVKPDGGGGYTTATISHAGTLVIFPVQSKDSWQYCGKWVELMVRVKDIAKGTWGQTHLSVRLYDTKDAPP
tara:strand:+ start:1146 stop:1925 length:780 start_codon:yes stop_codon:yes gene_type:complete